MAENRKTFKLKSDQLGEIKIADEVVAIIAGLAATEVEGVSSMAGNITNEIVSKLGMKNLSKGIFVEVMDEEIKVDSEVLDENIDKMLEELEEHEDEVECQSCFELVAKESCTKNEKGHYICEKCSHPKDELEEE